MTPTRQTLTQQLGDAFQDCFNHASGVLEHLTKFCFLSLAWLFLALGEFLIAAWQHIEDNPRLRRDTRKSKLIII